MRISGGTAREQVYAALREAIVSADLEQGRPLSENEFAELDAPVERAGMAEVTPRYGKNLEFPAVSSDPRVATAQAALVAHSRAYLTVSETSPTSQHVLA